MKYKSFKEYETLRTEGLGKWFNAAKNYLFGGQKSNDASFSHLHSRQTNQFKRAMDQLLVLMPNLPNFERMPSQKRELAVRVWLSKEDIYNDKNRLEKALELAKQASEAANSMQFVAAYQRLYPLVTSLEARLQMMNKQPDAEFEPEEEGGMKPMPAGWDTGNSGTPNYPDMSQYADIGKAHQGSLEKSSRELYILQASRHGVPEEQMAQELITRYGIKTIPAARNLIRKVMQRNVDYHTGS